MRLGISHILFIFLCILNSINGFGSKWEIGYNELVQKYGNSLPQIDNLNIGMAEAMRNGVWAPDESHELLAGTRITQAIFNSVGNSSHATEVGKRFFGKDSLLEGISDSLVFEASSWLYLVVENGEDPPEDLGMDLMNHSWIANTISDPEQVLQRVDYMIDVYNVLQVTGVDNNPTFPSLLANSHNAIVVGSSSGSHSLGGTILDGEDRQKPDIVADEVYTSYATPIVSSIAGLLISKAKEEAELNNALNTEVMKAIILAGAEKDGLPKWEHSSNRPLDSVYGVGEANVFHSFDILMGGEQIQNHDEMANHSGWDFGRTGEVNPIYFIEIPKGRKGKLSAILSWNRVIIPVGENWRQLSSYLANLDLSLWRSNTNGEEVELIYESRSEIDNVEHVFETDLSSGYYILEVEGRSQEVDYGLAWRLDLTNVSVNDLSIQIASGISKTDTFKGQIQIIEPGSPFAVSLSGLADGSSINLGESRTLKCQIHPGDYDGIETFLFLNGMIVATEKYGQALLKWEASTAGTYKAYAMAITETGEIYKSKEVSFSVGYKSPSN